MAHYVDGFVLPIRKDKIEDYRAIAEKAGAIWREHGALEYRECVGEDFEAREMVAFPHLAGAGPEETVVFAWITYRSREHRDEVNAKVLKDPRLCEGMDASAMPFDCKRIAFGGFTTLVSA